MQYIHSYRERNLEYKQVPIHYHFTMVEFFDILDANGNYTGESRAREEVHKLGLFHKAVHVWLFCSQTKELLLQKRSTNKDSWPSRWDISAAGHIVAGGNSLQTAQTETEEELGLHFDLGRFHFLFTHLEKLSSVQHGEPFINNEFNDVYIVHITPQERNMLHDTIVANKPQSNVNTTDQLECAFQFVLQEIEVERVKWIPYTEVKNMYTSQNNEIVPCDNWESYERLFEYIETHIVDVLPDK